MGREEKCNLSSISAHQKRAGNTFSASLSHTSAAVVYLCICVPGYLGIWVSKYLSVSDTDASICWPGVTCSDFGSNQTERGMQFARGVPHDDGPPEWYRLKWYSPIWVEVSIPEGRGPVKANQAVNQF